MQQNWKLQSSLVNPMLTEISLFNRTLSADWALFSLGNLINSLLQTANMIVEQKYQKVD